jgi:hypothetical protein
MGSSLGINLPSGLFIELVDFLRSNNDPREPTAVVEECIRYWMDNASWKSELLATSADKGFQWKELHLPAGTQIRMSYRGKYHYAQVTGDSMIFEGKATTPGAMVNMITRSSRNAWRDIWIKRPKDESWTVARQLRARS